VNGPAAKPTLLPAHIADAMSQPLHHANHQVCKQPLLVSSMQVGLALRKCCSCCMTLRAASGLGEAAACDAWVSAWGLLSGAAGYALARAGGKAGFAAAGAAALLALALAAAVAAAPASSTLAAAVNLELFATVDALCMATR
jgi:hypothetical protein